MTGYRPAEPSDAQAIAALHARSWRESYRGSFTDAFLDGNLLEERLRVWRARLDQAAENQFVQLAVEGTDLQGFICTYGAHDREWGSLIDNLHVARSAKRNGIGASLMRQAGAWLESRYPAPAVYLLVLETNTPARRFYEQLGGRNMSEPDASEDETRGIRTASGPRTRRASHATSRGGLSADSLHSGRCDWCASWNAAWLLRVSARVSA